MPFASKFLRSQTQAGNWVHRDMKKFEKPIDILEVFTIC